MSRHIRWNYVIKSFRNRFRSFPVWPSDVVRGRRGHRGELWRQAGGVDAIEIEK
jgi:hypothetical protein